MMLKVLRLKPEYPVLISNAVEALNPQYITSIVKQLKRPQSRLKNIIEEEEGGYDMLIIIFYPSATETS